MDLHLTSLLRFRTTLELRFRAPLPYFGRNIYRVGCHVPRALRARTLQIARSFAVIGLGSATLFAWPTKCFSYRGDPYGMYEPRAPDKGVFTFLSPMPC